MRVNLSVLLTLCCFCWSAPAWAQLEARGRVYVDTNGNGKKETSEPGVPGVAVSNGKQVVLTDERGAYSLPIGRKGGQVYVIKPSGYALPLDAENKPVFYYIHRPSGSPPSQHAGLEPTGPLPKRIDFALLPSEEPEDFKVLLMGDPQPYSRQEVEMFDKSIIGPLVDQADQFHFGLVLGDIVGDSLQFFRPMNQACQRLGIAMRYVYGNHDMNLDAPADSLADETFESVYGPTNYAFNVGKAHFIVLDNVEYPRVDGEPGYVGAFSDQQLEFLRQDLQHVPKDHLVVVAFHIPLFTEHYGESFRRDDRQAFLDLLAPFEHTVSLSAHTHMQQHHFFDAAQGWAGQGAHHHYNVGTTSGDWWQGLVDARGVADATMRDGTPNGWAWLTITGNTYTYDYQPEGYAPGTRMHLWMPRVTTASSHNKGTVYVNFYQGHEKDSLFLRIDGGEWLPMHRRLRTDPAFENLLATWNKVDFPLNGARPSEPVPCTHLWVRGLPRDLAQGSHMVEVQARDWLGRTYEVSAEVRIEAFPSQK